MSGFKRVIRIGLLGVVGAFAVAGASEQEAQACGGAWIPIIEEQVDHRIPGVAHAEKQLEKGQYADAAGSVVRMMPHIKNLEVKKHSKLVARALRVLAVATARSEGKLDIEDQTPDNVQDTWLGSSVEDKDANLLWAVDVLRDVNEVKKDDPLAQTQLAEALARVDGNEEEAFQILDKLAKKDLVASPEAYAVLADLKAQRGDVEGQKLALKRCAEMAPESHLCALANS